MSKIKPLKNYLHLSGYSKEKKEVEELKNQLEQALKSENKAQKAALILQKWLKNK